jgi:hypothetical protein
VEAVPESVLDERIAAQLPASAPPAPWSTRLQAVVWAHRAAAAAPDAMPARLRSRRRLPITVAAFVRYLDTPVGEYREILAAPVLLIEWPLPAATIPFIAVDSLASIVGGRANWGLPKTHASFTWSDDGSDLQARGEGWSIGARVRSRGPAFPFAAGLRTRQVVAARGELTARVGGRGRGRLGRVTVQGLGSDLPRWMLPGSHPAILVDDARVRFESAHPSAARAGLVNPAPIRL